jgi:hypothetical protein
MEGGIEDEQCDAGEETGQALAEHGSSLLFEMQRDRRRSGEPEGAEALPGPPRPLPRAFVDPRRSRSTRWWRRHMRTIAQDNPFAGYNTNNLGVSRRTRRAGRILSGIAVAFLLVDSAGKLLQLQPVIDGTVQLGYPRDIVFSLGVILLSSVLAYGIPRTSVLGALLLTGYLGGAVATHVRVQDPLVSHVLFPTYVAALVWGGLILRDGRLRAFLPIRRKS